MGLEARGQQREARGHPERGPHPEVQREEREEEDRAEGGQVEGRAAVAGRRGSHADHVPSGQHLLPPGCGDRSPGGWPVAVSQGRGQTFPRPTARPGSWKGRRTGRSTDSLQGGWGAQGHEASS